MLNIPFCSQTICFDYMETVRVDINIFANNQISRSEVLAILFNVFVFSFL